MASVVSVPNLEVRSLNVSGVSRLENGDRLKRPEFHRRYLAMADVKKAELIEGIVYMPSPVRIQAHGRPHQMINTWLGTYWAGTPGTDCGGNTSLLLDLDNEPQPDACLRVVESLGGTSRVTEGDYLEGPPELIVEIAGSSANYDLHQKRAVYARSGVQEYAVWRTEDGAFDWWELMDGDYVEIASEGDEGTIHSRMFPGLLLNRKALLEGRLSDVLRDLHRAMESPEHEAFRSRLAAAGG